MDDLRWTATIKSIEGGETVHEIEEIEDLQEIVERGINFSDIAEIVITYNRRRMIANA